MPELKYNGHRPVDKSDPGFTIPGHRLRWISAKVSENNPGRIWEVVRKSELPKEIAEHLKRRSTGSTTGDDTIRRGDLVLAYAPMSLVKEQEEELVRLTKEQQRRIARAPEILTPSGKNRAKVIQNEDEDVSLDMINKFKKGNEKGD